MYAYMLWADTTAGIMKMRNGANSAWISLWELDGTFIATDISLSAGTAGAPSLYFTGDTNTGIYSPGADQVAISSNSAQRLYIAADGKVGINSGSPEGQLHVEGGQTYMNRSGAGNQQVLQLNNSDTTAGTQIVKLAFGSSGSTKASINAAVYGNDYLAFNTGSDTERMRLTGTGLGIGVTAPSSLLEVRGTTDEQNIVNLSNSAGTVGGGATNTLRFTCNSGVNWGNARYEAYAHIWNLDGSEKARLDNLGRLLVGTSTAPSGGTAIFQGRGGSPTSSPLLRLNVGTATPANGDSLGYVIFGDSNSADGAYLWAQRDGGTWSGSSNPTRLVFSTTADGASSPTERMRIDRDGSVDFGGAWSSSLRRKRITPDVIQSAWDSTNSRTHAEFYNPNGLVGSISTSASATAYNTSSDYRLKENVVPVDNGILRLQQLKPSRFNFIVDPGHIVDGFIAHEVQVVVPEAIHGTKDEVDADGNPIYQGIDQSKLVPLLTAALQEAVAKIESLEARLTAAGI